MSKFAKKYINKLKLSDLWMVFEIVTLTHSDFESISCGSHASVVVDMPPRYTHGSVIFRQARVAHEGGVAHRPTERSSC